LFYLCKSIPYQAERILVDSLYTFLFCKIRDEVSLAIMLKNSGISYKRLLYNNFVCLCYILTNMRIILIIGAGRSASSLIQYLLDKSERKLHLVIGDLSMSLAENKQAIIPMQPYSFRYFDEVKEKRFKKQILLFDVACSFAY
jgi:FlaA1/EpsC-like NDP-sugar epimerase